MIQKTLLGLSIKSLVDSFGFIEEKILENEEMDLQRLFTENPVCLLSENPKIKVWRIINITGQVLNYLRVWLEKRLVSVAIDWLEITENTGLLPDEILAHRLGLLPIVANPLIMEDFTEIGPQFCTENTCLVFELNVENSGSEIKDILSNELRWIPLGNQLNMFLEPPHPLYPDFIITRLLPGQRIRLRAYAVRGTGEQHAKWSATFTHFRLIPTQHPVQIPVSIQVSLTLPPNFNEMPCIPCEQLPLDITSLPGFNCYYFTIELVGGLSFQDIQNQLDTRFDWEGQYPPSPIQYLYERLV